MKKSEAFWDFAMALTAFAGAFTLIQSELQIPTKIIAGLFGLSFFMMLATFSWRLWDSFHPLRLISADINIDTLEARRLLNQGSTDGDPEIKIATTLFAKDTIYLRQDVMLKLEKNITTKLNRIGILQKRVYIESDGSNQEIGIPVKGFKNFTAISPFRMRTPFTQEIDIRLETEIMAELDNNRFKIGFQTIDGHLYWFSTRNKL